MFVSRSIQQFQQDLLTVTGFVPIPTNDEKELERVVATIHPVAAAVHASLESFIFYADGVYKDKECKNGVTDINHAILIVGYGVEGDGTKYWIIKNSYGTTWGNGGYMKLAKDAGNLCGIATLACYPLV